MAQTKMQKPRNFPIRFPIETPDWCKLSEKLATNSMTGKELLVIYFKPTFIACLNDHRIYKNAWSGK
jgi:hypothetical protein